MEHIGLRTTRAEKDNRTKVISNSNMVGFYNLSRDTAQAAWCIGVPKDADVDRVRALIEGNIERFRARMGDMPVHAVVYQGMDKVSGGTAGDQYVLQYKTFCNIENWDDVRGASLEVAYKILMENGIQPFSGELLPL